MYGLDKNFAAPHTGIVLSIGELVAPVVFTLASLMMTFLKSLVTIFSYVILPTKKLDDGQLPKTNAPHVALIMVPGNFVTGAFKNW